MVEPDDMNIDEDASVTPNAYTPIKKAKVDMKEINDQFT